MKDPLKPQTSPPRFLVRAILGLRRWLQAMMDALTPAQLVVLDRIYGTQFGALVHVVTRAGIPALLAGGGRTAAELAESTGLDADALHRILRRLCASGVFKMDRRGRFSHNRASNVLRRDVPRNVAAMAEHVGIAANYAAYGRLMDYARDPAASPFLRANGADTWSWFTANPVEGALFSEAMQRLTEEDAPAIAAGYAFGRHEVVCDVAGGRGTLLAEILVRHPKLRAILFDAPRVVAQAGLVLGARGVDDRVTRVAGSFFEREIPGGADAYLLKNILHDWGDEACVRILGNVRAAMAPGTKLLVCEVVLEPASDDYIGSLIDVHMMVVCEGGRERSAGEFRGLFAKSGFRVDEVRPLAGLASLIVASAD